MKKIILTVVAVLVSGAMVFAFTGCSNTSDGENTTKEASSSVVAEESTK